MRRLTSILTLTLVAALAGCGGGGGGSTPVTPPPQDSTEPNDFSPHSAGTLSGSDIVVNAVASGASDVDLHSVTMTTPGALFVNLDWGGSNDLELAISNSQGVFVQHIDTGTHPEACTLAGLPAGTYTIRVDSITDATTTYTLTLGQR
jgi:hypothetical protein